MSFRIKCSFMLRGIGLAVVLAGVPLVPTRGEPAASYWGNSGPGDSGPTDSTITVSLQQPTPGWETVVDVPQEIIALPFRGAAALVGGGVILVDENHVGPRVQRFTSPEVGGYRLGFGISAGGLAGFGASIGAERVVTDPRAMRLRMQVGWTVNGSRRATAGIIKPLGSQLTRELEMGVGLRTDANARYFGLGPESHESRESFYSHEVAWGGVGLRQSLARKIQFEARLILSGISARSPGSEEPALATEFAGEIPPGYDDRSSGASTVLTLAQDTTTENGRPERGGVRRATFAWFQPTEGDAAFTTARLELQQFIPLWHSKRALALRGHVTRLHYKGDDPIPFQRLLTNDAPDLFRGYKEFRWRDQGLLGLTAEYRWPIWARKSAEDLGVDAYMLFDAGQVYHQTADISADNLTTSYGFGFRLVSAYGFIGTLEFGRSEEESSFRLGAEQVFQFSRNGLYFGRNPFPVR